MFIDKDKNHKITVNKFFDAFYFLTGYTDENIWKFNSQHRDIVISPLIDILKCNYMMLSDYKTKEDKLPESFGSVITLHIEAIEEILLYKMAADVAEMLGDTEKSKVWRKMEEDGHEHYRYLITQGKPIYSIDKTKCKGCGRCLMVCPIQFNAIQKSDKVYTITDSCGRCGNCKRWCNYNAIVEISCEK